MRRLSLLFCSAVAVFSFLLGSMSSRAAEPIVPEGARLEKLFEGVVLTEGVAVAPDGMVYFSDITFSHATKDDKGVIDAGHIWKFNPKTKKTTIFRSPSGMSNGIKFDAAGNMIICEGADYGGRRVIRTDMKTGKSYIIAGMYEGRPFNSPNDVTIDNKGRLYFSDPRYLGHEPIRRRCMSSATKTARRGSNGSGAPAETTIPLPSRRPCERGTWR